jgi:hypothetical protein
MAPELIVNNLDQRLRFSTKIDVYSFSILVWVLWTQRKPYPKHAHSFMLMDKIVKGERPELDASFPNNLAAMLKECWAVDPDKRPEFQDIDAKLDTLFSE